MWVRGWRRRSRMRRRREEEVGEVYVFNEFMGGIQVILLNPCFYLIRVGVNAFL